VSPPGPERSVLRAETIDGVHVITARGDLDLLTAPRLRALLDEAAGAGALLLDLTRVTFMDSTALNALLVARRSLLGTRIAIACRPASPPAQVFELTALHRVFDIHDDRATALAALLSLEA